ncbi:MAG TPA: SprT family zinc-dependent metalloprotease [Quisquiliibacterium sp.]|nr:SprT family zinc-dependent metalloprotease [Quisquiliibacterium sp.]
MKSLGRLANRLADAARQLTLPLSGAPPAPPVVRAGHRFARLRGDFVEYELRRSARRTIGFTIDERGLTVTAPRSVAQTQIDAALGERADWVLRKLQEWREHAARQDRLAVRWEHGGALPYLGETLVLRVEHGRRSAPRREGCELRIGLATQASAQHIRDSAQGWLKAQARALFAERLEHHAARHGTAPRRWALSSARTRWGSCSADGSIRLNWRLVHFPPDIVDYVICHELAHLREMNHGPRFWRLVGEMYPDYERARKWLRTHPGASAIGQE